MQRIAIGKEIKGGLMMNVGEYVIADSQCNKTERTSRWQKCDYRAERNVTYAKRYLFDVLAFPDRISNDDIMTQTAKQVEVVRKIVTVHVAQYLNIMMYWCCASTMKAEDW